MAESEIRPDPFSNPIRATLPRISNPSDDLTGLLRAWGHGDRDALDRLTPRVYDELRRIARRCMAGERAHHSLQATALVNEAFLRLFDLERIEWRDRVHFFSMAARLMRRALVDAARTRRAQKRGGDAVRITFTEDLPARAEPPVDLIALDEALTALAALDERKCQVVELRFFSGLSVEQTASALSISTKTVMRDWGFARQWLLREMRHERQR